MAFINYIRKGKYFCKVTHIAQIQNLHKHPASGFLKEYSVIRQVMEHLHSTYLATDLNQSIF